MDSKEFEKLISRIYNLLEPDGTKIIWNDFISDKSNPLQRRQIDITIFRVNSTVRIECRHRSKPQNVQWIEEMLGKKERLNLDHVVCVSSSGFTKTAKLAALDTGIEQKILRKLSDQEILEWKDEAEVYVHFFEVRKIEIYLTFQTDSIDKNHLLQSLKINRKNFEDVLIRFFQNCGTLKLNYNKVESYTMVITKLGNFEFGGISPSEMKIVGHLIPFTKKIPLTYKGVYIDENKIDMGHVEKFGEFLEIIKTDATQTSSLNFEKLDIKENEAISGRITIKIGDLLRTLGKLELVSSKISLENIHNVEYVITLKK